jgi:hypothetical protein
VHQGLAGEQFVEAANRHYLPCIDQYDLVGLL